MDKRKQIYTTIDGPDIPLPRVWSSFIAWEKNKADLARSLSKTIMQKGVALPASFEVVTGGGFTNASGARSTGRQIVRLQGNHEEAHTRRILRSSEAVSEDDEKLSSTPV